MKTSREMLEQRLESYSEKLRGLHSYIKELNDMTAKHGTDRDQFERDLGEAEQDVLYYETEIGLIENELAQLPEPVHAKSMADSVLPRTARQGAGFFIMSAIGFVAGALIASVLQSRSDGGDDA
jgi:hypothetical protein